MAGVPHHSVDTYLARLIRQRRVVAIAEQTEQPVPNRLVRREVVRVLTPGTVLEDQFLHPEHNNYLCAVAQRGGVTALACADVSTGEASVLTVENDDGLAAELDRIAPSEVVVAGDADAERIRPFAPEGCTLSVYEGNPSLPTGELRSPSYGNTGRYVQDAALHILGDYLSRLKLDGSGIAAGARVVETGAAMTIDAATRRHLDLLTGSGGNAKTSLLAVLTRTRTPMGSRLLAARLCAPLVDATAIDRRLDCVEALVERSGARSVLQDALAAVGDIERIVQKAKARRASPRDLATLRRSLDAARNVEEPAARIEHTAAFAAACGAPGPKEVAALLARALVEEPPPTLADGGAVRPEYDNELREAVELRTRSRDRLLALEAATRARSGIKSLRIKYTQAFGYCYEIPRAHAQAVPADFVRRQSLVNAERFSTVELKELESAILNARSRQVERERTLFEDVLSRVDAQAGALAHVAAALAQIDVACSLAQVAGERRYVRPQIVQESVIDVEGGRHPIVEAMGNVDFVANDCTADGEHRFLLITGPNMGGKSTYLRQTALLCVLAQMGSFVPASRARLGVVEQLFTRVGAGDDIASGRSTFFVEMEEMALILRRCTPRSLLLIDEVGRGTGTADGLAIAQAISEHLLGLAEAMPIVLFATHFHELVRLSSAFPVIENLHAVVADEVAGPVFSHRVLHGASSRSYGIAVAKMAGMPPAVVDRAREIADEIEGRPAPRAGPLRRRRDGAGADDQLQLLE